LTWLFLQFLQEAELQRLTSSLQFLGFDL